MVRSLCTLLMVAFLFYFLACSEENTAGVTEEENSVTAFEVATPDSYDLWSFSESRQVVGNENLGYWFTYGDSVEDNGARVEFSGTANTELSTDDMAAVIDSCGGLCGTVKFERSSKPVSAGIGFTLGKGTSALDASAWNGLCVTYKSELAMNMKFRSGTEDGAGDESFVEFPKVMQFSTQCAKWEDFKQVHSKGAGESAVKKLDAILFEFRSEEKRSGSFNIKGVGSYKDIVRQQENSPSSSSMKKSSSSSEKKSSSSSEKKMSSSSEKESSSSSEIKSSSSSEKKSSSSVEKIPPPSSSSVGKSVATYPAAAAENLWLGAGGEYVVNTRLFDETVTGGYWYVVEDTDSSEQSRIVWPVLIGDEYIDTSLSPIIDYCGGVCGSLNFESEGFAGVGFSIVNRDEKDGSMKTADITSWGGLCVRYMSSLNVDVVMNGAASEDPSTLLQSPKVTLPSNDSLTTRCVEWDEFGAGASSHVASLLFVFQGVAGTVGEFNIVGLGTLVDN